jgi:hypothetical protein
LSNEKSLFSQHEAEYLSQFSDNPLCAQAVKLAITHLDVEDEVNVSMLRRLVYVTSVAAQSTDDDVFVAAMLHPLNEFKPALADLSTIMTGLGYEALKVVQVMRETTDYTSLYTRIETLEPKFKAIAVARVMYRLSQIDLYEYQDGLDILDEAENHTANVDAPRDIMVQFNTLLRAAKRVFNEIHMVEELDEDEDGVKMTSKDMEEYIEHKKLADELGIINKETRTLPDIGVVTYYDGVGFCDENGELVNLSKEAESTKLAPIMDVSIVEIDINVEKEKHHRVARLMSIRDGATVTISGAGKVTYDQNIGFITELGQLADLSLLCTDK